jgi:RNA polymerase sigma-70 factor, ECF subfamily
LSEQHDTRLEPAVVAAFYNKHADELQRFLFGLLRDWQLVQDVLQTSFTRLMEQGHTSQESSRKAWLFRVAYHEAMLSKRKAGVHDRALRRIADGLSELAPDDQLVRRETVEAVREGLQRLTPVQREVVQKRIYEGMTFAEIAQELDAPLGTVLGRMHSALRKLREGLNRADSED